MIYNRKNTSKVVASWKNYLNNNIINEERNVNNSEPSKVAMGNDFETLYAILTECGWSDVRIDTLANVLERANITLSELDAICNENNQYEEGGNNVLNDDPHLSGERM
jgi:hypothetical protein